MWGATGGDLGALSLAYVVSEPINPGALSVAYLFTFVSLLSETLPVLMSLLILSHSPRHENVMHAARDAFETHVGFAIVD